MQRSFSRIEIPDVYRVCALRKEGFIHFLVIVYFHNTSPCCVKFPVAEWFQSAFKFKLTTRLPFVKEEPRRNFILHFDFNSITNPSSHNKQ